MRPLSLSSLDWATVISDFSYSIPGASFVQTLVQTLSGHLESSNEAAGKESTNLISLLAELYNFQIISCVLIFDLIRKFLEGSLRDEKEVELLLKVVRSACLPIFLLARPLTHKLDLSPGSGSQLRSDDPTSLKDIIQIVHQKVGEMQPDAIRCDGFCFIRRACLVD